MFNCSLRFKRIGIDARLFIGTYLKFTPGTELTLMPDLKEWRAFVTSRKCNVQNMFKF